MKLDKTYTIFLTLIRYALFRSDVSEEELLSLSASEWKTVMEISQKQGVYAIAFDAYQALSKRGLRLSLSEIDLMKWFGYSSVIEKKYLDNLEKSKELAQLWKDNCIDTLVFKGLAMSRFYPIPSHREFGDFDCYLFGCYDKGNLIAERAGSAVDTGWYKHSQIRYKTIIAENHVYFTQCRKGKKERNINAELIEALGDPSVLDKYDDTCLLLPSLSFEGLFMVYHTMAHFLLEGLSLRQICDWACWMHANQNHIAWGAFYHQCRKFDLERMVDILNAISVKYLGLEITNRDISFDESFADKVLLNTLFEDSKIYSRGGKWYSRFAVIGNAFKYSWKYREVAKYSMHSYIWSYIYGFIVREEED